MAIKDAYLAELKHESALTQKILERVPMEQAGWKPHEKSMTLGRLASHIADTFGWISRITAKDDFDFQKDYVPGVTAGTSEELLRIFRETLEKATSDLSGLSDEDAEKIWTVSNGDQVMFRMPKKVAFRGWAFSHLIHHRGQLSVYLRQLNVPVPGMYGPSADEGF